MKDQVNPKFNQKELQLLQDEQVNSLLQKVVIENTKQVRHSVSSRLQGRLGEHRELKQELEKF